MCNLDDPARSYALGVKTYIHHGVGGCFMAAGIYWNMPFLWRHGMMTEAGGLDVYEMSSMIYARLCPPGAWPLSVYAGSTPLMMMLFTHHLVGLSICVPLCIYYSGNF